MKIKQNSVQKALFLSVFILLALLLFNLFNTVGVKSGVETKISELKEQARPANLELISIKADCDECFTLDENIVALKNNNVKITNERTLDSSSQEAKALINEYNIEKLPTIVLKGEIDKTPLASFKKTRDALVFDGVNPPYIDAVTGEIAGMVSATILLDKNCEVCNDFSAMIQGLEQGSVVFSEVNQIDYSSPEAKELITKYEIKKIPSLILSQDISVYSTAQDLRQVGFQYVENSYVIESGTPYVEADTGKVRGAVTLTILTDDSCGECYDAGKVNKPILARFGLAITEEKTVDISSAEGKELLKKYNITKVPTILLTGDAALYENLNSAWRGVGTVEDDGAYVFRGMNILRAVYKDLSTGEVLGK